MGDQKCTDRVISNSRAESMAVTKVAAGCGVMVLLLLLVTVLYVLPIFC